MERDPLVHLVDDGEAVRRQLCTLVEAAGYRVNEYPSAESFLSGWSPVHEDEPAVVLADLGLPGLDGIALAARLASIPATPPVVLLSAHGQVSSSVRAMKAGAVDFLEKPVNERALLEALTRALEQSRHRISRRRQLEALQARQATLTRRERQVFAFVVSGMLNKQVAGELGVSEKMVKVHRARMLRKMAAQSLPDLVRMAFRLDIAPFPALADADGPTSPDSGSLPGHLH
jgi:FixJ family two-component response regulator